MRWSRGGGLGRRVPLCRRIGRLGIRFGMWGQFLGLLFLWRLARFLGRFGWGIRLWHDSWHGRSCVSGGVLWGLRCCPLGLLLGGFLCLLTGLCRWIGLRGLLFLRVAFRRKDGTVDNRLVLVVCVVAENGLFVPLCSLLCNQGFNQWCCLGLGCGLGGSN